MMQLEASGYTGTVGAAVGVAQNYVIALNLDPDDPWSNQQVRQAVYLYGIDWDNLALVCGGDKSYHTSVIGMHESPFYDESIEKCSYNPEKAKELLAEAGYPNGFTTDVYTCGAMHDALAAYVQANLKTLGITANIISKDFSTVQSECLSGQTKNGLVFFGQMLASDQQTDRFTKHFNPFNATISKALNWGGELETLWKTFSSSETQEDMEKNLLVYNDYFVNEAALFWPAYTSPTMIYFQDWYHEDLMAACVSAGYNPFDIDVDKH